MKSIFYNPELAKTEQEEKKSKKLESEKRAIYFERLKKDKNFQKYIIQDIIDSEINNAQSITSEFVNLVGATPETVKSLLMDKAGRLKAAQNIKNAIVNS